MEKSGSFDSIDMLIAHRLNKKASFMSGSSPLADSFDTGFRSASAHRTSPPASPVRVTPHLRKSAKSSILKKRHTWAIRSDSNSNACDFARLAARPRPPDVPDGATAEFTSHDCGIVFPPHDQIHHGTLVLTSSLRLLLLCGTDDVTFDLSLETAFTSAGADAPPQPPPHPLTSPGFAESGLSATVFSDVPNVAHLESMSHGSFFVILPLSLPPPEQGGVPVTRGARLLVERVKAVQAQWAGDAGVSRQQHQQQQQHHDFDATLPLGALRADQFSQGPESPHSASQSDKHDTLDFTLTGLSEDGGVDAAVPAAVHPDVRRAAPCVAVGEKPVFAEYADSMEWGEALRGFLGLAGAGSAQGSGSGSDSGTDGGGTIGLVLRKRNMRKRRPTRFQRDKSRRNTLWNVKAEHPRPRDPLFQHIALSSDEEDADQVEKYDRLQHLYALEGEDELAALFDRVGSLSGGAASQSAYHGDWRFLVTDLLEHVSFLEKTGEGQKGVRQLLQVHTRLQNVLEQQLAGGGGGGTPKFSEKLLASTVQLLRHSQRESVRLQAVESTQHLLLCDAAATNSRRKG